MNVLTNGPDDAGTLVIIAHGAGAAMDTPFMEAIAGSISTSGRRCMRFEFPYMAERRATGKKRPPDRAPVLIEVWKSVIENHRGASKLIIGGKSMGGRFASMIADDVNADGLICLGYPFHPPGKPEKLRVDHLAGLKTPSLFLQGERDPFGTREEVSAYDLSENIELAWLPDGEHSFKPRKASGHTEAGNIDLAGQMIADYLTKISA